MAQVIFMRTSIFHIGARRCLLILCIACAALLLARPAPAMEAVREAIRLCTQTIVPSLFPFLVCSALLTALLPTQQLNRWLSSLIPVFFYFFY